MPNPIGACLVWLSAAAVVALCLATTCAASPESWVLPPPTLPPAASDPLAHPVIRLQGDVVELVSPGSSLRLSLQEGLTLQRLRNGHTGRECLPAGASSPLFAVLPDDVSHAWVGSRQFAVTDPRCEATPSGQRLSLKLSCAELKLTGSLSASVDSSDEMIWSLTLRNDGATVRRLCVCFPMLEGLSVGANAGDDYYFYPMVGGWCANLPYDLAVPYGLLPGSLQVVAAFNPSTGGGVYAYVRDDTGSAKIPLLRKVGADGKHPPAYTPQFDPAMKREPSYTPAPFGDGPGISMGMRTLWLTLAAGESWSSASVVTAAYAGDFRQPLERYCAWVRTWWRNPGAPQWTRAYASFTYAHSEDSIRGGKYVARPRIEPKHQLMQWAYWWKHADCNRDGKDPRPDRWYRECHGDYEYEDRWGGREALQKEVRRYQERGARMTFYLQSYLVWKQSAVAKAHHEEWGAMWTDGTYNDDYTDEKLDMSCWGICPRAPGWQQYLLGVCDRLMADTHPDGLYLDSLNGAQFCINPRHTHEREPAPGLRRLLEQARAVVRRHNPEGMLWVEFPSSDYLMQFVDCTWLETFSSSCPIYTEFDGFYGLHFLRFYFPELAYAEWNPDAGRAELMRRNLFNGVGSSAVTPYDEVMQAHADAFATLHPLPLVPTEVRGVLANLFPTDRKRVYTVWNRTGQAVSGVILRVPQVDGARYSEAVSGREVRVQTEHGADRQPRAALSFDLPAGDVACIVELLALSRPRSGR